MDMQERIEDAQRIFNEITPELVQRKKAGDSVGALGATGIKLFIKSERLYTFWVGTFEKKEKLSPFEAQGVEPPWQGKPIRSPQHLAILLDLKFHNFETVGAYLSEENIFADLLVISPTPNYASNPYMVTQKDWQPYLKDFNTIIATIRREIPGRKTTYHIFSNGPLPLILGFGATWGSVSRAEIYHYEQDTYTKVFSIDREKIFNNQS